MTCNNNTLKIVSWIIFSLITLISEVTTSKVDPCEACETIGEWYKGGCSGLTAALLGRPYKSGSYVNDVSELTPGDIVGWKGQPYGHVAVYVGYGCCDCRYVEAQLISSLGGGYSSCRLNGFKHSVYFMHYDNESEEE